MTLAKVIVLVIAALAFVACSSPAETGKRLEVFPVTEAVDSDEVYSAAIEEAFANSQVRKIYISTNALSTKNNNAFNAIGISALNEDELEALYSPADSEAIRSFFLKYAEPAKLDPKIGLSNGRTIEFLDGDLVDRDQTKTATDDKPTKLPGPFLRLSRIGFNSTRTEALVQLEYVECPLCGFGSIFLLDKTGGKWIVWKEFSIWKS